MAKVYIKQVNDLQSTLDNKKPLGVIYTQASHGLVVGNLVYVVNGIWTKAIADSSAITNDSFVTNIVAQVIDTDTILIATVGSVLNIDLGYSTETPLYLSQTIAGDYNSVESSSGLLQQIGWYYDKNIFFNPEEYLNLDTFYETSGVKSDWDEMDIESDAFILNKPTIEPYFEKMIFNVHSDASVSDDISFNGIINIDTASLVLHPKLVGVSFEVSTDTITYTQLANLSAVETWLASFGSGIWTIRVIAIYGSTYFGSATVSLKFNQL